MKKLVLVVGVIGSFASILVLPLTAQTAFSYQGRLADANGLATGRYDFEFTLWDSASGGGLAAAAALGTPEGVGVTNGLFTVLLDFGAGALTGAPRWVQVGVRTNGSTVPFTTVMPRQGLPTVPYAVYAAYAGSVATGSINPAALGANAVTSAKIAPGEVVKGLNNLKDAVTLQAGSNVVLNTTGNTITISATAPAAPGVTTWNLGGNTGTTAATNFLGTKDNQPLELRVNNTRALRFEVTGLGQPNLIAGNTNNAVAADVVGAVVAGGATNTISSGSHWSLIGGGRANTIRDGSYTAGIVGGTANEIQANAPYAFVGGGFTNVIRSNAQAAMIMGGFNNSIGSNAQFAVVTGGRDNAVLADAVFATIAGGGRNTNQIATSYSAIGGGRENTIQSNAQFGVIIGGYQNTLYPNTLYATVAGGYQNRAAGNLTFAAGNRAKANHLGTFVWADATPADLISSGNNQFLIRATGGVGIGTNQPASALHVLGTVTATNFAGNGAGLSNLPVANLTGVLAASQVPNLDAAKITTGSLNPNRIPTLDAAKLGTGTLADSRLSTNVALLDSAPSFSGPVSAPAFAGSGASLTALSAANLAAGTLADARLSANVPLLAGTNLFVATNQFAGVVLATNAKNQFVGSFRGDGTNLTNLAPAALTGVLAPAQIPALDADKITTGTLAPRLLPNLDAATITTGALADARLSANVPLLTGTNFFIATNQFAGVVLATHVENQFAGAFRGNGANLTNLAPAALSGVLAPGQIPALDAEKITTGVLTPTLIPNLDAAKIATGTLAAERIPALDAAKLATGTVADNRLSTNVALLNAAPNFSGAVTAPAFSGTGANLTALHAANVTSGTLADARLSANVPLLAGTNFFIATNQFAGVVLATNLENQIVGRFRGDGANLTALDAANVAAGTLADARLSANVPLLAGTNLFTATNQFAGVVLATHADNQFVGRFHGDGAGLSNLPPFTLDRLLAASQIPALDAAKITTGIFAPALIPELDAAKIATGTFAVERIPALDAANVTAGTLDDARLSANVPLLAGTNFFIATNQFTGVVLATHAENQFAGSFRGNGANLTNLPPAALAGVLAPGQIPALDADKITTGILTPTLIPNLDAAKIATGTLAAERLPNLDAAKLSSGTVADARLSTNVVLLNTAPTFSGPVTAPTFSGSGANLTALDAANVVTGTLVDARLSANVALLTGTNLFTATNQFTGIVLATNVENQFVGSFRGNGANLTNLPPAALTGVLAPTQIPALDAAKITTGTFADERLSPNVPRLNADNTFTGALAAARFSGNGVVPWQTVSSTTQTASVNTAYLLASADRTTVTLPATASAGDLVRITGAGAGGWQIAPGAGGSIVGWGVRTWIPRAERRFWSAVAASADATRLVATVNFGGRIFTSADAGETWTARENNRHWETVAASADGTKLVAAEYGGQLYTSTDAGATWTPRESIRSWISVASSADGTLLFAAVWGDHLFVSTDSGVTWNARENNRYWRNVASSADGTKLVALDYFGSALTGGQIYISPDAGAHWTAREANRYWRSVAMSADGTRLVAVEEGGRIYTSTDSGATWTPRENRRAWQSVASSADGTKLAAVASGEQLYTSTDSGATWAPRENLRAWQCVASSADGAKLVAAVSDGQIFTSTAQGDLARPGVLPGGVGEDVTLQYLGSGQWQPLNSLNGTNLLAGTIADAAISPTAAIADAKLATLSTPGKVANSATTATSANAPDTIVARDAAGSFSAATITATRFIGDGANLTALNGTNLTAGTIADAAISPTAAIADAKLATLSTPGKVANSATTATSANAPDTIVARDAAGSFSAATITAVSFIGDGANLTALSGANLTAGTITDAAISPTAAIADSKLATLSTPGKVANSATTATNANVPDAIIARDTAGNFSAGTVTLSGTLDLPSTTATAGFLTINGSPVLHSFGENLAVGANAGNFTMTGLANTAVGNSSLAANTTGERNTALGLGALGGNTSGVDNVALGHRALSNATVAAFNVAVGNAALALATGSNNLALGHAAGADLTTGSGNIVIGHRGVDTDENTTRLGTAATQTRAFIAGIVGTTTGVNDAVPVMIDGNGQLGTVSSSRRYKEDIADMGDASARLLSLRPVTFRYQRPYANGEKPLQFGLIAEEVAAVFPELTVFNSHGQPETVKYQDLTPLLLNEVQKLRARNATVEKELSTRTAALEQQLAELRKLLESVAARQ